MWVIVEFEKLMIKVKFKMKGCRMSMFVVILKMYDEFVIVWKFNISYEFVNLWWKREVKDRV